MYQRVSVRHFPHAPPLVLDKLGSHSVLESVPCSDCSSVSSQQLHKCSTFRLNSGPSQNLSRHGPCGKEDLPVELYRLVVQQHGAQKSITMMVWYQMHKGHVKLRQCQSRKFPSIPVEILEQASCSSCSLSPEHDQLGKHETPHSLDTNPQILGCLTVPCGKGSIRKHW